MARYGKRAVYIIRSLVIVVVATLISLSIHSAGVGKENAVMVYIVGVILVTVCTTGYFYGAASAVLSVLIFNYFVTEPFHTFAVMNRSDMVLMFFFLMTAFISSSVTVRFQKQKQIAEDTRAQMEREHLKSSLLRSISHDFRTPLTGILGDCSLLAEAEEMDSATRRELAGEIQEQAIWLIKMMENILNMTKIENGQLYINKQPEVVDDIVYEAVTHVTGLREKRDFKIELPSELVVASLDGPMMVQVLINLLDNAMKHTKMGGMIRIRVVYKEEKVYFKVEDNGEGIAEELLPYIFDEFVTQSEGRADRQRGIGLGLAICKAVVEAHGGEIYAKNREEGGACVGFWLNATQADTDGR
ncbi:ATP-binding protein [Roseburia hominis]